jgi:hypothetical protein
MYGYCADASPGAIGWAGVTPRCDSGAVLSSVPPLVPSLIPRCVLRSVDGDAADATADAAPNSAKIAAYLIQ